MAEHDPTATLKPYPPTVAREHLIFSPAAGKLPPPEVLEVYARIDPSYPREMMDVFKTELRRNFIYQILTWTGAILFASLLVCSATFLSYTGHPRMASAVVGVNLLGIVGKFLAKSNRGTQEVHQDQSSREDPIH
jgi:hypothetical protein